MTINSTKILFAMFIGIMTSAASGQDDTKLRILDQPTHIEWSEYEHNWPELGPAIASIRTNDTLSSRRALSDLLEVEQTSVGALNMLAQIDRLSNNLDEAAVLIKSAIALSPDKHLHYFQLAMINYAYMKSTKNKRSVWNWHKETTSAYQKAYSLKPDQFFYNYYLIYSLIQTPSFLGGDKEKALNMASKRIDAGDGAFYVVRGDVLRVLKRHDEAFNDYDQSIRNSIFKTSSYTNAGYKAIDLEQFERAKKYFEYLVVGRPNSANSFDSLGDYYLAVGDEESALDAFTQALKQDATYAASIKKLEQLANLN